LEEIKAFWGFETPQFKRALIRLFVLAAFVAVLELLAIVLLFPLLALIADPDHAKLPSVLVSMRTDQTPSQLVGLLVAAFTVVYLAKAGLQAFYYRLQTSLVARAQSALAVRLLRGYMSATYLTHLSRNSSELIRTITVLAQDIYGRFLNALLTIVADATAALVLIVLSIAAAPLPAIAAGALIVVIHVTQHRVLRTKHFRLGEEHVALAAEELGLVSDSLNLFREARITGREEFLVAEFARLQGAVAANASRSEFLKRVPTAIGEIAITISVAAALFILLLTVDNLGSLTVVLGLLVAIAFRLSPIGNRLVLSAGTVNHSREAIFTLARELKDVDQVEGLQKADRRSFKESISLKNVSFCYPARSDSALTDISLNLRKGELLGITGPSGAGKSTLIDVLLGLLSPTTGTVIIDDRDAGREFQLKSSYVPQSIVLFNDTLLRNITFESTEADVNGQHLQSAIELSGLASLVGRLPDGLLTPLGDKGGMLSGGERQRVGLARALYLSPDLLVLDEPTSALDKTTEAHIIRSLEELRGNVTTVVVSHSEALLRACDRVLRLRDGKLEATTAVGNQNRLSTG